MPHRALPAAAPSPITCALYRKSAPRPHLPLPYRTMPAPDGYSAVWLSVPSTRPEWAYLAVCDFLCFF